MTRRSTIKERTRLCPVCQNEFLLKKPSQKQRCCSHSCAFKEIGDRVREKAYTPETIAKQATALRDRGAGKGYRKFHGRHEHRVVAEQMIARPLHPDEVVHHKDGNKRNNHPDNLEVMLRAEHSRMHTIENRKRRRKKDENP